MAGYTNLTLTRFLIGAIIISVPAIVLSETGSQKYAWAYVGLILLSLAVFYGDQLSKFTKFIQGV
jgi:hypothetical protein